MAKAKKGKLTIEDALVPVEEQPYEIPENWCWTKLESIVSIVTGKKDANYGSEEGEYTFFTCAGEPIRCDGYSFEGESLLLPGNGANVGQVFYYDGKFEAYQRTYVLQGLSSNVNLKYLYYQMLFAWNDANKDKQFGSATNYIKMGNFTSYNVPLPPLAEQKRIVEQIENLFAKLDEATEKAQGVVEQFELHKESILHQAFSGYLSEKWRIENGISADSWEQTSLGIYLNPMKTRKPEGETFRYIDIDAIDNKKQVIREAKETPVSEAPSRASRAVNSGDVLFSMVRPYLKNIAYVTEDMSDCIVSTGFYVCSCKDGLYSKYLYELLRSKDAIDYLMQFMKGDNSPSIRKDDLLDMPLRLPCIDEQKEICQIVSSLLQKEEEAKEAAVKVIDQIDLMKKSILAKAFRGELGTNIADEESSIELLKSIIEA